MSPVLEALLAASREHNVNANDSDEDEDDEDEDNEGGNDVGGVNDQHIGQFEIRNQNDVQPFL